MNLQAYTSLFLLDQNNNVLLLKRAKWMEIGPGKFNGIGGHIEEHEFDNIEQALLREVKEETLIAASAIEEITFRGTIFVVNRGETDHLIYYFIGRTDSTEIKNMSSTEGELSWFSLNELDSIDFFHTIKTCYKYLFDESVIRFSCIFDESDKTATVKATYKE